MNMKRNYTELIYKKEGLELKTIMRRWIDKNNKK